MNLIADMVQAQRTFWNSGMTRSLECRKNALDRLEQAIRSREKDLLDALYRDLRKTHYEGYASEIGMVLAELRFAKKHLARWAAPRKVPSAIPIFPAKCQVRPEPYGVALILSPWNYPVQLTLAPLISAIAAGNCAILKPSELSPACSETLERLVAETFDPRYIAVVNGGRETSTQLLAQEFDSIFFTGSTQVGKVVMEAAAQHLTPVTLELGGKSPVIMTSDVDLKLAARRLVWGKFLNAGQTCVAPDHIWVPEGMRDALVQELKAQIACLYGPEPLQSPDLPNIISQQHFDRICALMKSGRVAVGGKTDPSRRLIEPTVLVDVHEENGVMGEEIFGPVLPVLTYQNLDELLARLQRQPRPLALYVFTKDRAVEEKVIRTLPSGGVCVNDTVVHLANPNLPFGGVGASGMGRGHGKHGFDAFTHYRTVVRRGALDVKVRYAPYDKKSFQILKKLM